MESGIKDGVSGIKGALNRALASRVETILKIPGSKLYKKYVRAVADVEQSQAAVLDEVIRYANDTVFGKEHGFDKIRSYQDFVENVPIRTYEEHRPYVERHIRGEEGVLFPGKPLMYTRSSGTTAESKMIPITPFNFERTIKNRGKLWLYGLSRSFPGVYAGKDFTLVSPAEEGQTEDGTPYGSLSGVVYQNIPEFMKLVHTVPYSAITISDYDAKAYTLLRFGLPSDVSVILTGNPATVVNLAARADAWKEELIRDIRDGTLKSDLDLEPEIRAEAEARLVPAPERAAELDRLAGASDRLRPADYWPNLRLVHTWKNGNTRLVIPKLRPWLNEDTPILDFGYLASEITATDLIDPQTDGSLLSVQAGFYEFSRLEQGDSPTEFLLAHQLKQGERYFVYVTTFSGLYRYDINDVVEVVGHFHEAPILRFLYKGKGITNIQGEKVSEEQLIEAVARAGEATGISAEFFVGFADPETSRYTLYAELAGQDPGARKKRFAAAVDDALCKVNIEYEAKRSSDRLKPLAVENLGPDAFARYRMLRLEEGAHEGQLKWLNLSSTEATRARMRKLMGQTSS